VNPKSPAPLIPLERIEAFVQLEPALVILGFAVGSWLVYKLFLRQVSQERHQRLRGYFANLLVNLLTAGSLFTLYQGLTRGWFSNPEEAWTLRLASWVGLLALLSGAIVFVKSWRILIFQYLVLGHMKVGVPVLLVNLFTLITTLVLTGWIVSEVFSIRLAPLLATSAIFSLVVGLALQDTLGNLFSGVALQLDKPYEIGDWIEVADGGQKWVGQVDEITWRATVLVGFTEEAITIPNRVMGQSKIFNYSAKTRPFVRSQLFRVPYGTPVQQVKETLVEAASRAQGVLPHPAPFALISETTESWYSIKLIYFLDQFGQQYLVADEILTAALEALERRGVPLAAPRLVVVPVGSGDGDKMSPRKAG
jgi:small-conductance mechanosensitive channel